MDATATLTKMQKLKLARAKKNISHADRILHYEFVNEGKLLRMEYLYKGKVQVSSFPVNESFSKMYC